MNIKVLQINEVPEKWIFLSHYLFQSRYTSKKEKTMHSCSASSGKPDSNSLDCIVFSFLEVYRDWNRWSDEGFTFLLYLHSRFIACADALLMADVSVLPWYSPLQMLFWQLLYLQGFDIRCCRCSFLDQCICNLLFFELADTFQPAWHV